MGLNSSVLFFPKQKKLACIALIDFVCCYTNMSKELFSKNDLVYTAIPHIGFGQQRLLLNPELNADDYREGIYLPRVKDVTHLKPDKLITLSFTECSLFTQPHTRGISGVVYLRDFRSKAATSIYI